MFEFVLIFNVDAIAVAKLYPIPLIWVRPNEKFSLSWDIVTYDSYNVSIFLATQVFQNSKKPR